MNKFTITLIIIGLFTGFYIYTHHKKSTSTVLNVINATTFQIDLNSNGVFDDGETVCVPNIKTFSLDLFEQELSKAKGISFEDHTDLIINNQDLKIETILTQKI